ncbi:MAG: hypothetical protein ACLRMJ_07915 [Alistipes finegoldii]
MGGELMSLRGDGREECGTRSGRFRPDAGPCAGDGFAGGSGHEVRACEALLFNSGEFGFTKLVGVDYGGYAPKRKGFWIRNWGIRSTAPLR